MITAIQRAPIVGLADAFASYCAAVELLLLVARSPAKAMRAGTSVRLSSTATATVAARCYRGGGSSELD